MKYAIRKRLIVSVFILALCLSLMTACGEEAPKEEANKGPDTEFLIGSWTATTVSQGDKTVDALDAFGGDAFSLYFQDDGKCQMSRGENYSIVDWTMNDDGSVTLKGDGTYEISFPDNSKTEMICVINEMEVLLEKYES